MRRLLAAGSALGLLAHNAFETRAGVGLVFEPFLTRRGAYALWAAYFPAMLVAAAREGENARRLTAFAPGSASPGSPSTSRPGPGRCTTGLPMLDEAEGLSEAQLPAYNAVLWFWLICSALSLPAANRPGARRFAPPSACSTSRSCSPPPSTTSSGPASKPSKTPPAGPPPSANGRWAEMSRQT